MGGKGSEQEEVIEVKEVMEVMELEEVESVPTHYSALFSLSLTGFSLLPANNLLSSDTPDPPLTSLDLLTCSSNLSILLHLHPYIPYLDRQHS